MRLYCKFVTFWVAILVYFSPASGLRLRDRLTQVLLRDQAEPTPAHAADAT